LNIPNILTIIRLCLMPVFLVVYFLPIEDARMWAMGVLLVSFVTDMLDGFIARTFNQITNLGKILDPIADKLMQITVLICLAIFNKSLIWIVVFVFIKDAILGIGAIYMYKRGIIGAANWFGKISCFVSLVSTLVLIFPFSQPLSQNSVMMLAIAIAFVNACALVSYSVRFYKTAFRKPKVTAFYTSER